MTTPEFSGGTPVEASASGDSPTTPPPPHAFPPPIGFGPTTQPRAGQQAPSPGYQYPTPPPMAYGAPPQSTPLGYGAPTTQQYAPPSQFQGQSLYSGGAGSFGGSGRGINVLGIIALVIAALGFLFACMPGWLIVGWVLLPVGFILGIVSLFLRGRGKALGITAIVVSVVGTIVGFVVFFSLFAGSFNDAFNSGAPVAVAPGGTDSETDGGTTDAGGGGGGEGTRENPYPLGTTLTGEEWAVTINSITFGATDAVMAENQFNQAPPEGYEYILVNTTAVYSGPDSDFGWSISVDYVTPTGETMSTTDTMAVGPGEFDGSQELYTGGTVTGNIVLAVPSATAGDGVLAVTVDIFGDPAFVAVR